MNVVLLLAKIQSPVTMYGGEDRSGFCQEQWHGRCVMAYST